MSAGVGTIDAIGPDVAEAGRAQLQQRIPPTRIAQVDAGDGEVQRDLLVRLEGEVGQVELVAVDPVPVLLVAGQALGEDGDALVPEEPLVPFEGLTPGRVLGGVPRDLVRDGIERQGLLRLEQDQDEVGDALEPVQLRAGAGWAGVAVAIGTSLRHPPGRPSRDDGRVRAPLRLASAHRLAARRRGPDRRVPVG